MNPSNFFADLPDEAWEIVRAALGNQPLDFCDHAVCRDHQYLASTCRFCYQSYQTHSCIPPDAQRVFGWHTLQDCGNVHIDLTMSAFNMALRNGTVPTRFPAHLTDDNTLLWTHHYTLHSFNFNTRQHTCTPIQPSPFGMPGDIPIMHICDTRDGATAVMQTPAVARNAYGTVDHTARTNTTLHLCCRDQTRTIHFPFSTEILDVQFGTLVKPDQEPVFGAAVAWKSRFDPPNNHNPAGGVKFWQLNTQPDQPPFAHVDDVRPPGLLLSNHPTAELTFTESTYNIAIRFCDGELHALTTQRNGNAVMYCVESFDNVPQQLRISDWPGWHASADQRDEVGALLALGGVLVPYRFKHNAQVRFTMLVPNPARDGFCTEHDMWLPKVFPSCLAANGADLFYCTDTQLCLTSVHIDALETARTPVVLCGASNFYQWTDCQGAYIYGDERTNATPLAMRHHDGVHRLHLSRRPTRDDFWPIRRIYQDLAITTQLTDQFQHGHTDTCIRLARVRYTPATNQDLPTHRPTNPQLTEPYLQTMEMN